MKKLFVAVLLFGICCNTNAYINSPMDLNIHYGTPFLIDIVMPAGMSNTIDGPSGGYWALIGVDPSSGVLAPNLLSYMDMSGIYGDAGNTCIFISGIGVVGSFVSSRMGSWTVPAGIFAKDFTLINDPFLGVYLFKISDDVKQVEWVPGVGSLEPPPDWIFAPEPATLALFCLTGLLLRNKK